MRKFYSSLGTALEPLKLIVKQSNMTDNIAHPLKYVVFKQQSVQSEASAA